MQLSQPTLEPHSLCYTCWVQVVYSLLLPLPSLILLRISLTAAQYLETWKTTSAASTTSRRFVSQSSSLWCPASERVPYMFLRFGGIRHSCLSCNNNTFVLVYYIFLRDMCCDILMILWYICETWSWRIYMLLGLCFVGPGVTKVYASAELNLFE